ncbi:MAG: energy transducer TonB [Bacteroidales bacterium]|nr:energy transducer TonB [Bacteroidales bacterium]
MEAKKSQKADLEKKKGLHLEIGLVTILALVLVAFNLRSTDKKDSGFAQQMVSTEMEEEIIQTQEEQQQEPEPEPEQPEPEVTTELEVVDDDAELTNELGIVDAGDNANKEQQEVVITDVGGEDELVEDEIFVFVEEFPSYPGGEDALYKYLYDNIQYPDVARDNNISGTVVIRFVVEKDGSITKAAVAREIGGGCGKEALRVVNGMPKWKPGKQSGKAVRTEFTLPVQFQLD